VVMHPATNNLCDHVAIVRFGRLALIPSRLQRKSGFRPSRRSRQFPVHMSNPLGVGCVLAILAIIKAANRFQCTLYADRHNIA